MKLEVVGHFKSIGYGHKNKALITLANGDIYSISDIMYSLYTFLYILHKKASILAICTIVYKVTTMTPHLIMGENCVISGSMHLRFQSERFTK